MAATRLELFNAKQTRHQEVADLVLGLGLQVKVLGLGFPILSTELIPRLILMPGSPSWGRSPPMLPAQEDPPIFHLAPTTQMYDWGKPGLSSKVAQLATASNVPGFCLDESATYAEVNFSHLILVQNLFTVLYGSYGWVLTLRPPLASLPQVVRSRHTWPHTRTSWAQKSSRSSMLPTATFPSYSKFSPSRKPSVFRRIQISPPQKNCTESCRTFTKVSNPFPVCPSSGIDENPDQTRTINRKWRLHSLPLLLFAASCLSHA
jgi:hypothetical protein